LLSGLALTAVQHPDPSPIVPSSLFGTTAAKSTTIGGIISRLYWPRAHEPADNLQAPVKVHALTILARLSKNLDVQFPDPGEDDIFLKVVGRFSAILNQYADEWSGTADFSDRTAIEAKANELIWMNVVIYGICGWSDGRDFNADFFL
jgi:hypothetical protein